MEGFVNVWPQRYFLHVLLAFKKNKWLGNILKINDSLCMLIDLRVQSGKFHRNILTSTAPHGVILSPACYQVPQDDSLTLGRLILLLTLSPSRPPPPPSPNSEPCSSATTATATGAKEHSALPLPAWRRRRHRSRSGRARTKGDPRLPQKKSRFSAIVIVQLSQVH